jgi:hypothetical protein
MLPFQHFQSYICTSKGEALLWSEQWKICSAYWAVNHLDLWIAVDCVVQERLLHLVITLLHMPPVHDPPHFCKSQHISVSIQLQIMPLASSFTAPSTNKTPWLTFTLKIKENSTCNSPSPLVFEVPRSCRMLLTILYYSLSQALSWTSSDNTNGNKLLVYRLLSSGL